MGANSLLAERIIDFHEGLKFSGRLPAGFAVMNPFESDPEARRVMRCFYRKFYADRGSRKFLIGINPGRLGAGVTGIPFTDTKHLIRDCGIPTDLAATHEPSAAFVYRMIAAYGGVADFYGAFYIHSLFPLALLRRTAGGKWRNCNYYDVPALYHAVAPFMKAQLAEQVSGLGLDTDKAFVLGKKNLRYFDRINRAGDLFGTREVLEHPRYVQQYRFHDIDLFVRKYLRALKGIAI